MSQSDANVHRGCVSTTLAGQMCSHVCDRAVAFNLKLKLKFKHGKELNIGKLTTCLNPTCTDYNLDIGLWSSRGCNQFWPEVVVSIKIQQ